MTATTRGRTRPRLARAWGGFVCLTVLLISVALLTRNDLWRIVEAKLAAGLINLCGLDATTPSWSSIILVTGPRPQGLLITQECTSGYLIGAIGLVAAPLFLIRRLGTRRAGLALAVTSAIIILTNMTRMTGTAWAIHEWGLERGLRVGHDLLGTLLTTIGTSISGVVALAVILPHSTRRFGRRRRTRSTGPR